MPDDGDQQLVVRPIGALKKGDPSALSGHAVRHTVSLPPGAVVRAAGVWSVVGPFEAREDDDTPWRPAGEPDGGVGLAVLHARGSGTARLLVVEAEDGACAVRTAQVALDPDAPLTLWPRPGGLGVRSDPSAKPGGQFPLTA